MLTEGRDVGNPPPGSPYDCPFEDDLLRRLRCSDPHTAATAQEDLCLYTFQLATPVVRSRIGADTPDHDDLLQDIALVMLEKIDRYEDRGKPLAHYITAVAKNTALDHVGRRIRHWERNRSLDDYALDPKEQSRITSDYRNERAHAGNRPEPSLGPLDQTERDRLLQSAIKNLSDNEQRVVKLNYFTGITSSSEIARLLGLSAANVRKLHERARGKLRKMGDLDDLLDDLCLF